MSILVGCLAFGLLCCAVFAIRARRLVASSLWLAALSALLSVLIYMMGASRIAVIELSVGAGLVTVLLVFVVGIVGDEAEVEKPLIPSVVSWGFGLAALVLLGVLTVPLAVAPPPASQSSLASLLWQDRALDVLLQVVLIFCGVMGVLGLLPEGAVSPVVEHSAIASRPPVSSSSESVAEGSEAKQ